LLEGKSQGNRCFPPGFSYPFNVLPGKSSEALATVRAGRR